MTLTLTAGITATDRVLGVTGAVDLGPGYLFRLDDELLEVTGFEGHDVQYPTYRQLDANPNRWYVRRALQGTTAASHTEGADVLGVSDAYVASDSDTPPGPFTSSGSGGTPAGWTVDGDGTPVDVVTPSAVGDVYFDATNGAVYLAVGVTSADWLQLGGSEGTGNVGSTTGVVYDSTRNLYILAGERDTSGGFAYFGDAYSQWNGNSQGLLWQQAGTALTVRSGPAGEYVCKLQDNLGVMTLAAGGLIFPDADPGVEGAWWDNAGTLTKSTG